MSGRERDDDARLVWSSERGGDLRGRDAGGDRPRGEARAGRAGGAASGARAGAARGGRSAPPSGPADGVARVRRETAGRHGKTVTTVHGLRLAEPALRELASELKRLCGTGGSAKDGVIEIQGDHVERLLEALRARGFEAKRAGG